MAGNTNGTPRVIALVGPQSSGKTTLLEGILSRCGKIDRKNANATRLIGDFSPEAKARDMGTEINVVSTEFMGDPYIFLDCPGSIELAQETLGALQCADAAVIVTEADADRITGLAPTLKLLDDQNIPHYIFVNKVDRAIGSVRHLADAIKGVSERPIVVRQIPIRDGDEIKGYVDLAQERAHIYHRHQESKIVDLPDEIESDAKDARYAMLETLADFDEKLMEELLEDVDPSKDEVMKDLAQDLGEDLIVPVMIGSAVNENGVHRLLKAIRHEVPGLDKLNGRLGITGDGKAAMAHVLKTFYMPHMGKISLVRLLSGSITDADTFGGSRPSGLYHLHGDQTKKITNAKAGDVIGLGRMDHAKTGQTLFSGKSAGNNVVGLPLLPPVYSVAVTPESRDDETKLVTSLAKLCEEDPSLSYEQTRDTHEILLRGQGDVQLQLAIDRLNSKYGVHVTKHRPQVPYKETIKKSATQHSRFKKQSGGHGQFGDVVVEVKPLPAGTGFAFDERITGGAVPKQYIPSVEAGVKDYLTSGPLGFPVVDVGVTLVDGSYHNVDSSDQAFKMAGRLAMSQAMPDCSPVLLEPIMHVKVHTPSEFTGQINAVISGRRGQILGFDGRDGWQGWDTLEAHLPQSEMHDLIIELRSISMGAATYEAEFARLSELTGKLADQVLKRQQAAE